MGLTNIMTRSITEFYKINGRGIVFERKDTSEVIGKGKGKYLFKVEN